MLTLIFLLILILRDRLVIHKYRNVQPTRTRLFIFPRWRDEKGVRFVLHSPVWRMRTFVKDGGRWKMLNHTGKIICTEKTCTEDSGQCFTTEESGIYLNTLWRKKTHWSSTHTEGNLYGVKIETNATSCRTVWYLLYGHGSQIQLAPPTWVICGNRQKSSRPVTLVFFLNACIPFMFAKRLNWMFVCVSRLRSRSWCFQNNFKFPFHGHLNTKIITYRAYKTKQNIMFTN